jgi:DNA-binding MarR family transcriptional regulator
MMQDKKAEELLLGCIERLSETMRQSMRVYRKEPEYGALFHLTITQLHYLHSIDARPAVTASELAEYFQVKKSTVTNIIGRLVKQGYVIRRQSLSDGRIFHLSLTAEGHQLLQLEKQGYGSFAKQAVAALSAAEQAELRALLAKIMR